MDYPKEVDSNQKQNYRLHFVCNNESIYFTRRETECILHLLDGKTVVETARSLQLSARTVEYYVSNMKLKMSCSSKREMLTCFTRADFTQLDML